MVFLVPPARTVVRVAPSRNQLNKTNERHEERILTNIGTFSCHDATESYYNGHKMS